MSMLFVVGCLFLIFFIKKQVGMLNRCGVTAVLAERFIYGFILTAISLG